MESIISNTAFLIDNSYFPFIIYQSNTVNTIIKDTERKPVYIPQEYCESPCCCNKSCCNKKTSNNCSFCNCLCFCKMFAVLKCC